MCDPGSLNRIREAPKAIAQRRSSMESVIGSSVLHAEGDNPKATIVGDLIEGLSGREGSFDCLVGLLHGIGAEELTEELLLSFDRAYRVIIGVVARAAG